MNILFLYLLYKSNLSLLNNIGRFETLFFLSQLVFKHELGFNATYWTRDYIHKRRGELWMFEKWWLKRKPLVKLKFENICKTINKIRNKIKDGLKNREKKITKKKNRWGKEKDTRYLYRFGLGTCPTPSLRFFLEIFHYFESY